MIPHGKRSCVYRVLLPFLVLLPALLLHGCQKTGTQNGQEEETCIYLTVRSTRSGINSDTEMWEDRVDELRMVVFSTDDGSVVFNEKLYFPNGFGNRCKPVRMLPGEYDFCFIANEGAYPGDFVDALLGLGNKSDFGSDPRFTNLRYNPGFMPDGTTENGRFLMSAMYGNITVERGGTETNPVRLGLPMGKVELVRSLAKVEVVFRKRVPGSDAGSDAIGSVRLDNVASVFSVPPYDGYYTGDTRSSVRASLDGFGYDRDSIGAVTFYIPEFLVPENGTKYTELNIDNKTFPIITSGGAAGMAEQGRSVPPFSENSVVRNFHYVVNAYLNTGGDIQVEVRVKPWKKEGYLYMFEGDLQLVIPPIMPTDSSIIIGTDCGKVEILSRNEQLRGGLHGAYHDVINWGSKTITRGEPPYYCEEKYGEGWRLINVCELMSFLSVLDAAYSVWMSNTWDAYPYLPVYPRSFRMTAQLALEKLTGLDLSDAVYSNEPQGDNLGRNKMLPGILWSYFVPGDIMVREADFPDGWPYPGPPGTGSKDDWIYNEVVIQLKAFWDAGYITMTDRRNWEKVIYQQFYMYTYSSTTSRCVRSVE